MALIGALVVYLLVEVLVKYAAVVILGLVGTGVGCVLGAFSISKYLKQITKLDNFLMLYSSTPVLRFHWDL